MAIAVHAEAPARVDFTGGFTDVPPVVDAAPTLHVSAAIDRTVAVRIGDGSPESGWRDAREAGLAALLGAAGVPPGAAVHVRSTVPAGAGLGSSGAAAVAVVAAIAAWQQRDELSPPEVARAAVEAERASGAVCGCQDEYAAAYGSVRSYVFHGSACESADRLAAPDLDRALVIFRAEGARSSSVIVGEVIAAYLRGDPVTRRALARIEALSPPVAQAVAAGDAAGLGTLLREVRRAQVDLHPTIAEDASLLHANELIEAIPGAGAKFLGAGGRGGSLLVAAPHHERPALLAAAAQAGCTTLDVRFAHDGVRCTVSEDVR